jgi:hypothetical protein
MARGNVDIFVSRRTNFEECEYWLRDVNADPNELVYKTRRSNGSFYAKISNPETFSNNIVGGVFMFDTKNLMLETYDNIDEVKLNDVVRYNDNFYIVTQVQKYPIRKNTQFHSEQQYITYLSLRG